MNLKCFIWNRMFSLLVSLPSWCYLYPCTLTHTQTYREYTCKTYTVYIVHQCPLHPLPITAAIFILKHAPTWKKRLCQRPNLRGIWCHHVFASDVCITQHWIPPRTPIYFDQLTVHIVPKWSAIIIQVAHDSSDSCVHICIHNTYIHYI